MKSSTSAAGQKRLGQPPKVLSGSRQRRQLLVVDDDLCMRESAALYLMQKGYACTTSENAVEAVEQLKRNRFDLIITDLHMPEMDGMALLEWTKARWPHTKVMIITGDTDVEVESHAVEQGVDSYLTKPFSLDRFLREVDGCLMDYRSDREVNPEGLPSTAASCGT